MQSSWDREVEAATEPPGTMRGHHSECCRSLPEAHSKEGLLRCWDSLHFTSTALVALVQASPRPLREAVLFSRLGLGEDSSDPEGWPSWGP